MHIYKITETNLTLNKTLEIANAMENAALLSSKIEETKENNEFTHKIGQQYHKPQNTNYRKKHYPQDQYQHQQRSTPNNNTQSYYKMWSQRSPCRSLSTK